MRKIERVRERKKERERAVYSTGLLDVIQLQCHWSVTTAVYAEGTMEV